MPLLVGKENITCYDAVSRRAGHPLSTPALCHNAVAHLGYKRFRAGLS